jgi:hypothetical protein
MATALGLPIKRAVAQEYGTYIGCGGTLKGYVGILEGPLTIRLSSTVCFTLDEVRVFEH